MEACVSLDSARDYLMVQDAATLHLGNGLDLELPNVFSSKP